LVTKLAREAGAAAALWYRADVTAEADVAAQAGGGSLRAIDARI
jgi:hypothetical protein